MNIYVGNLSFDVTDDLLRKEFEQFGAVKSAQVVIDKISQRSRGFGFIEMTDGANAQKAIKELNGKELMGRQLTINEAKPREERPRDRGFSRR